MKAWQVRWQYESTPAKRKQNRERRRKVFERLDEAGIEYERYGIVFHAEEIPANVKRLVVEL